MVRQIMLTLLDFISTRFPGPSDAERSCYPKIPLITMAKKERKTPEKKITVRRTRERFRRRKNCILRKANELAQLCSADVFVIVRKNDRYFVYNSEDASKFPPPPEDFV